jgi:signal transduction histidine kinase
MTLIPQSFGARLLLLFVAAVGGAQILAFAVFMHETTRLDRTVTRLRLGEQVETLVRLIDGLPPEAAARAVAIYDTPRHHYTIAPQPSIPVGGADADTLRLTSHMLERMRGGASAMQLALRTGGDGLDVLLMSVHLRDGRWLNVTFAVSNRQPSWMRIGFYQIAASLVAVLMVVGLARRGIVGPIIRLAEMARRLGQGQAVPVLPERGPREVRTLTAAFNAMQEQLRTWTEDRTQMLVAIGHDLRTPIASLWLRAEMIEQDELRIAMIATIRQMGEMVDATLDFAGMEAGHRASQAVNMADIARSVVDEHAGLGHEVVLTRVEVAVADGDRAMLRRAIDNLVSNAVRYAERVWVSVSAAEGQVTFCVEDDGPGIPPDMLQDVLKPFVRLDSSRGDATGGIGLGLAVVQSVVRAHGGILSFRNREQGGLSVEVLLPGLPAPRDQPS